MDIKQLNEELEKILRPIYFEARNYDYIKNNPKDFHKEENKSKYYNAQYFSSKENFFKFLDKYIKDAGNVNLSDKEELARFLYGHDGYYGESNLDSLYKEYLAQY